MLCLAILGRNVDQQVVKSVPPKSKEDNAMTDRWKDAGPGGDIFDALMSVDGGEKRTIQDTRTGEYREVYRGPGQTTGTFGTNTWPNCLVGKAKSKPITGLLPG